MTLDVVPQEILEHIAYFLAADQVLGPPSHLTPLLLANRKINARLSIKENPHFYAVAFSRKFDVETAKRRLGDETLSSEVLAEELKRRFSLLKRIRSRKDCLVEPGLGQEPDDALDDILVTSYLMVLENDRNNKIQLLEYARLDKWLKDYLFHADGASGTVQRVRGGSYPLTSARASLAMWLFWFFLKPSEYPIGTSDSPDAPLNILKALALSAPQYNLTHIPWTEHSPSGITTHPTMAVTWYSRPLPLTPPPLAIPAILSFLALVNRRKSIPAIPSDPSYRISPPDEWKAEWGRAVLCGTKPSELTDCFVPGSIEGVWEGFFTYTEFTAYAAMLGGADPQFIQKSIVGRHQQTWKLREWHLISEQEGGVDSLRAGDPLFSYFPAGCKLSETSEDLSAREAGREGTLSYSRAGTKRGNVVDIIITGEGHSAWGQFSLTGRIRPCDGFISLSKDYVDDNRGKWLYRGYLVGNAHGNFVGRWRDTLSSVFHHGYEGCFAMSRRR